MLGYVGGSVLWQCVLVRRYDSGLCMDMFVPCYGYVLIGWFAAPRRPLTRIHHLEEHRAVRHQHTVRPSPVWELAWGPACARACGLRLRRCCTVMCNGMVRGDDGVCVCQCASVAGCHAMAAPSTASQPCGPGAARLRWAPSRGEQHVAAAMSCQPRWQACVVSEASVPRQYRQ